MIENHPGQENAPVSQKVLEQWSDASPELAVMHCFSWIPASAGMTESDALCAHEATKFRTEARGALPPWVACAGSMVLHGIERCWTGRHIPSFREACPRENGERESTSDTSIRRKACARLTRGRESTRFTGLAREWTRGKHVGLRSFAGRRSIGHQKRPALQRPLLLAALAFISLLVGPLFAAAADADLLRTWHRAFVVVPGEAGPIRGWIEDIDERLPETLPPLPTVIYLHGCAGLGRISHDAAKLLAEAGYAVIMPDSFAREHKPKSCDPERALGGLHRGVLGWRQAEANQAIREARRLAWVDPGNVFLWGFSEGGNTTATVTGEPVNARVVEGWTCHAGWGEYRGLNAPPTEPVLALLGAEDPWFRPTYLRGDCGAFMEGRADSESIVYERPSFLATKHHLSWHPDVQRLILDFLARHRRAR